MIDENSLKVLASDVAKEQVIEDSPSGQVIIDWLTQISLLKSIPFQHLIADTRLLPIESIRFFYVDDNWIQCLIDGALSLGIINSQESIYQQAMKKKLKMAVDKSKSQYRTKRLKLPLSDSPPTQACSGFLLRSELVSSWPGLKVMAYKNGAILNLLRKELLAPDVMICLYSDVMTQLDLEEPSEGLVFGIEQDSQDDGEVALRFVSGDNVGKTTGQVITGIKTNYLRSSTSRVLNVAALQTAMAEALGTSDFLSADFALQMIKEPEVQSFPCPPAPKNKLEGSSS